MLVSNALICLLTLFLVTCIESQDVQGAHQKDGPPQSQRRRRGEYQADQDWLSDSEKEKVLEMFNGLRGLVDDAANMLKLKWSSIQEHRAMQWAEKCDTMESKNLTRQSRMYQSHGIRKYNVASPTKKPWGPLEAFYRWFDEMHVSYEVHQCKPKPLCHETNKVIRARSLYVGCVTKTCDPAVTKTKLKKGQMLLCRFYNVPLNEENKETPGYEYIKGERCSKCPRGKYCVDKLCDSGPTLGMARGSDAARPNPAHPFAILIAMAMGLAITTVGTRLVDF